MDESGFPLNPKPIKTVNCCGSKNPYCVSSGSKSQVSIAACVSAAGQSLPPYITWRRKTLSPDLTIGELPGTEYGLSDKGWMNSVLIQFMVPKDISSIRSCKPTTLAVIRWPQFTLLYRYHQTGYRE